MNHKKNRVNAFEIGFYEKLVEKRPTFIEALSALGDLYTKEGMYEKGLAIDLRLFQLKPEDPIVLYNLACSYSLLNHIDLSLDMLKKAISLGFEDINYLAEDEDLLNLRKDSRFQEFMMSIKK